MLIDFSNQNEGEGRGFKPVPVKMRKTCAWGAYFKRRTRFQRIRRALRAVLNRKA